MPTFIKRGGFAGFGGIDYEAQYKYEQQQRDKDRQKDKMKDEIIRQTEIATGKLHALVDGEDRYFTAKQYKQLFGDETDD